MDPVLIVGAGIVGLTLGQALQKVPTTCAGSSLPESIPC